MTPLYSRSQIRQIEAAYNPAAGLMEKAGMAVASLAKELLVEEANRVLVVAGPGNNGGDAFVAARYLKAWWFQVTVVFIETEEALPNDAKKAYQGWIACGGKCIDAVPDNAGWDLVIDGLFGIGLQRPLQGSYLETVQRINAIPATVLAIDIPSGLDAETGNVLGLAVEASRTITFLGLKPGLLTMDGPDHAGIIHSDTLGTQAAFSPAGWLVDSPPALLPKRRLNSHKGRHGNLGIVGGCNGMVGAALLTARAGLLIGAGKVLCGLLADEKLSVDVLHTELMLREPEQVLSDKATNVLAIGPGMGVGAEAKAILKRALALPIPLILDADGLNLVAQYTELKQSLIDRPAGITVITPHPGEASSLLATSTAALQQDRIGSALRLAKEWNAITVLKGCGTVIAFPDGRWYINASGNPGLSAAGMGDTLTGVIGGLAAQGMPLEEAALLGVYLHGAAADALVASGVGPVGLTASEVALECRKQLNQWIYSS